MMAPHVSGALIPFLALVLVVVVVVVGWAHGAACDHHFSKWLTVLRRL